MSMFCRQCEETAGGEACTVRGVCGKDETTAALQDLLVANLQVIGVLGKMAGDLGVKDKESDLFVMEGLFTTVTNVNFDPAKIQQIILESYKVAEKMKNAFLNAHKEKNGSDFIGELPEVIGENVSDSIEGLAEAAAKTGIMSDSGLDEDIRSLREILLYGLKGMAAYADHALVLGEENEDVNSFFYKGLAALTDNTLSVDDLIAVIMEFGQANLKCMEILDKAHTERFGHPVPTQVSLGFKRDLPSWFQGMTWKI